MNRLLVLLALLLGTIASTEAQTLYEYTYWRSHHYAKGTDKPINYHVRSELKGKKYYFVRVGDRLYKAYGDDSYYESGELQLTKKAGRNVVVRNVAIGFHEESFSADYSDYYNHKDNDNLQYETCNQYTLTARRIAFLKPEPLPEEDNNIYIHAESNPTFQEKGGLTEFIQWVKSQITYKPTNGKARIIFKFVIEKSGIVSTVEILKSPSEELSKEVSNIIRQSPPWTPARKRLNDSDPVRFSFTGVIDILP